MWFETRLALGALSGLAATTCVAAAVRGQTTASRDSSGRSVILTLSYTGELVQDAVGGSRHGAAFAGVAGGEVTLLLKQLVGGMRRAYLCSFAARARSASTGYSSS